MIVRFALLVVVGLGVSGCGMLGGLFGGRTEEPKAAADERLESARRNAALAFEQGRFDQARQLYRQALDLAMTRDDGILIGDIGYNLAVTELRRGEDAASLAMAQASASELRRRSLPIFAELGLVEAAAFYRLQQIPAAELAAANIAGGDGNAARRARFLLGLIAADRGDGAALALQIAALGEASTSEWRADRAELEGRAAALRGDPDGAIPAFAAAAEYRREALDYPSMARALAAAGEAAGRRGDAARAADFYLRAGRSALIGDLRTRSAERWLSEAERFARAAGDGAILEAVARLRARGG